MKKRTVFLLFFFLMFAPFIVNSQNIVDMDIDHTPFEEMPYIQKISMDFEEALLKDVLKAFSKQTGANFVASNLIEEKTITIFLSDVTMEEALATILSANDLTYEMQESNIYLIKPAGTDAITKETRVFQLSYIQVYNMPEAIASGATMDTMGGSALAGETSSEKQSILAIITTLLSPYGKIITEQRTNSLVITDVPEVFKQIEETLLLLDVEPVQIMIQAEIIETTTNAIKNIGIKYGSQAQTLKVTYGATADGEGQNFSTAIAPPLTENFINQVMETTLSSADLFQYGTLTASSMEILMQLFQSNQDTKTLSSPRVLTINNEPAIFKVAADAAIGTESVNVTQTQQTISQAERVETGVILKVIPQVNKHGDIFMYLEPSIATAQTSAFSADFMDPQVRASSSTVIVKDSETVMIAGLIKTNNVEVVQKVPFLGDIPLFGEVFRSRNKTAEDTEVLIFVTPHVVKKRKPLNEEKIQMISKPKDKRQLKIASTLTKYKKQ